MSAIQVKTRDGVSPQGRPRIYFSCHHRDFSRFFDPISEKLLKLFDCAIYYRDPDQQPDEETLADLTQMQLFVFPVTPWLLQDGNYAMDVEFPFAQNHHIPVLPLMQENGLDTKFRAKFGDLQFLNQYQEDATAISYEEKLKTFLSSVLVGDELARQVRDAFDAYIFLSYRKKDRKYAQELMRLIHAQDFCRDIAIWYDEFLTPGEDFNNSIREALEKSKLFALAVTPNLVNEPNYVAKVEYPEARKSKLPILPAQMVQTDDTLLAEKFPDLPERVDAHDSQKLSEAMLQALSKMAITANDRDPQHNFFIGLAYLNGIDVEVDHSRAVELITGAAEAGLTEAMEKLADMYFTGHGVQRDVHQAVAWMEQALKTVRSQYERTQKPADGHRCYTIANTLCSYWCSVGRTFAAEALFEETETLIRQILHQTNASEDRIRLIELRVGIVELAYAQQQFQKIQAYAQDALKEAQSFYRHYKELPILRCCYELYKLLSQIYTDADQLTKAASCQRKASSIAEKLYREDGDFDYLMAQIDAYRGLASINAQKNNYKAAIRNFKKAAELLVPFAERSYNQAYIAQLDILYQSIAAADMVTGDLEESVQFSEKALLVNPIREDAPVQPERLLTVAFRWAILGATSMAINQIEKTKQHCTNALSLLEEFLEFTRTAPQWHSDISESEEYQKSIRLDDTLTKESAAVFAAMILKHIGYPCLDVYISEGNYTEGEDYITKCLDIFRELATEEAVITWLLDTMDSMDLSADDFRARGRNNHAVYTCLLGIEMEKEIPQKRAAAHRAKYLLRYYERLTEIYTKSNDPETAAKYQALETSVRETLHEAQQENEQLRQQIADHILQADDSGEDLRQHYGQARDCYARLAESEWTMETLKNQMTFCLDASCRLDDRQYLLDAFRCYLQITRCYPEDKTEDPQIEKTFARIQDRLKVHTPK